MKRLLILNGRVCTENHGDRRFLINKFVRGSMPVLVPAKFLDVTIVFSLSVESVQIRLPCESFVSLISSRCSVFNHGLPSLPNEIFVALISSGFNFYPVKYEVQFTGASKKRSTTYLTEAAYLKSESQSFPKNQSNIQN